MDRIVDLNLKSALFPSQAAARAMIASGRGGRILNISCGARQLGINAGFSAYVAAKGALNALTRQHAVEWAKYGITVNAISPPSCGRRRWRNLLTDETFRANLIKADPVGSDRRGRRPHRRGHVLLFGGRVVRDRPGPDHGRGLTATQ